jgi:hypothetical protein
MATLADIRTQYPQYNDMPDDQLVQAFHQKFYADMPLQDFQAKLGYKSAATAAPKEGDELPPGATPPQGMYAVTGDDGKQTLRHNLGAGDIINMLSDLPGVGAAERLGQGATRLAGKAASGIAGLFGGGPDTVAKVQGAVNNATELPPSNDPMVQAMGAATGVANKATAPLANAVGNMSPGARTGIESVAEAIPDIAGVLGLRGAGAAAAPEAAGTSIAKSGAEIGQEAGYTGLKTKADLASPGAQAITNKLIGADAGMLPDQAPNVANLRNAIRTGPGKVYDQTRERLPSKLTQDPQLQADLSNLPQQVSQLPRSPDVQALQDVMLSKPDMTKDELFANISESRERAKANWNADDPDKNALGDAYSNVAKAYESFIDRQPGVNLPAWQQARVQMAKNYMAQGALRDENFNAQTYGRVAQKSPDLLTGNAAIVGATHNGLPAGTPPGVMSAAGPAVGGALAGEVAGQHIGFPGAGAMAGAVVAPAVKALLERFLTRGNSAKAAGTSTNPALSYLFEHPEAPTPASPPAGDMPGVEYQAPGVAPGLSLQDYTPPPAAGRGAGGPSLADLLSNGVERPAAPGLTAGPMGAPPKEGLPFRIDPSHMAGGLSLADEFTPRAAANNSDMAAVASQGVPEGITARTPNPPPVQHEVNEDTGEHTVTSADGATHGQESGPFLIAKRDDTAPAAQGQGQSTARMISLLQQAEARGLRLGSDVSVSPPEQKVFERLQRMGYSVERNPNASVNPKTNNLVSDDPRNPVFIVHTPLAQALGGR